MEYFNVLNGNLRSPEYIGSRPADRGTWLSVASYSTTQENGGRIPGGAKWKDRQWQQTCGVTLREIQKADKLLCIDGDDILVWAYPIEQEIKVKTKRNAGRLGGIVKTIGKIQAAKNNGILGGRPENPCKSGEETQAETQAETEGKPKQKPNVRKEKKITPVVPLAGDGFDLERAAVRGRLSALFFRAPADKWSDKEERAFRKIVPVDVPSLGLLEAHYAWLRSQREDYTKQTLLALLNDFPGQVGRAKGWAKRNGGKEKKPW